jgi:SAM-dependent methyltransferase
MSKENMFEEEYFKSFEFKNGKAVSYEEFCNSDYFQNETLPYIYNKIIKYKKSGRFLDVGCAFGFFAKKFEKDFEVFGFDISNHAIKKAKQLLPKFKNNFFVHNAEEKWPFPKKFFDVILMWHIIEHLPHPKKCLENAFNCLKDDGILFIGFPTKLFELPKWLVKSKKTIQKINDFLYPLKIRNLRIQFNTDQTHVSSPWPFEIVFKRFLKPFFVYKEVQPSDLVHQLIAGCFDIIAVKNPKLLDGEI